VRIEGWRRLRIEGRRRLRVEGWRTLTLEGKDIQRLVHGRDRGPCR
jgi:hypothetical protein